VIRGCFAAMKIHTKPIGNILGNIANGKITEHYITNLYIWDDIFTTCTNKF